MGLHEVSGAYKQASYIASIDQFKNLLKLLEQELHGAKDTFIEQRTHFDKERVARYESRLKDRPDDAMTLEQLGEAQAAYEASISSASEKVLPFVNYSRDGLSISSRAEIDDLDLSNVFPSKDGVYFYLGGLGAIPQTIRVTVNKRLGLEVSVSSNAIDWTERTLSIAQREAFKGRPWWAWLKHPATRISTWVLYLVALAGGLFAQRPLSIISLIALVVLMIPLNAAYYLPGAVIRDPGDRKPSFLVSSLKWVGTLFAGGIVSLLIVKVFG